jgi:hypothetical protein
MIVDLRKHLTVIQKPGGTLLGPALAPSQSEDREREGYQYSGRSLLYQTITFSLLFGGEP